MTCVNVLIQEDSSGKMHVLVNHFNNEQPTEKEVACLDLIGNAMTELVRNHFNNVKTVNEITRATIK